MPDAICIAIYLLCALAAVGCVRAIVAVWRVREVWVGSEKD
jgi:hypothetical protein